MKKIIVFLFVATLACTAASAQEKKETKSKHTSTVPQKMHNAIHPRHKKYSGHKTKHKTTM